MILWFNGCIGLTGEMKGSTNVNKDSKKIDFLCALGLNIIFFVIYVFILGPKHETNDDLALSLLVEGAYGERSPYMIYSNILWGKLLVGLYTLLPTIKWYVLLMLLMLFFAYQSMTYVFLRMQGRKIGTVISTTMLFFCGYYSYVVFQYSRIAPVVTAGGIILLFYAIEHADCKKEKMICITAGIFMAVWGSLIRFQMFAVAVVLAGGAIGLYKVWIIYRKKQVDWLKQIGTYVAVFGTVGVLSLACYVIDRMHYSSDEWQYFQVFNEVRTELWDYGFPNYEENRETFESIGISESDFAYYQTWNMDEEVMTIEHLQAIADEKPAKTFNIIGYISIFPAYFFSISVFIVFVLLAFIAMGMNWKNMYFVAFEGAAIMLFEMYFYYSGRYGIARVDHAMCMVAVFALIYAVSEDLTKYIEISWKKAIVMIGCIAVLFVADYCRVPLVLDGEVGESKAFFEEVMQDDEHLYIMTGAAPSLYYTFAYWEPSELGELSNIYNAYGWEFNHEVKKAALERYGIENIYCDSINNEDIYFVTMDENEMLETYIQENYDANAVLVEADEVEGVTIWKVCSE